jgi:hypothetical protein
MHAPHRPAAYGSQATSIAPSATSPAILGIGLKIPQKPLISRPWTARDWAIAAFWLAGPWRNFNEILH